MFFFDTYALIEIIKGSPAYSEYVKDSFITTRLNLMELYYSLLRLFDEKTAEHYYNIYKPSCVLIRDKTLKAAMRFRLMQRKQRNLISYVDCIGYFMALEYNMRFLTGEKHFLGLKNVEFVR